MGRPQRAAQGGLVYHTLNRAVARLTIFEDDGDFTGFEQVWAEAVTRCAMRVLAYCLMPNPPLALASRRWYVSQFMQWLTLTHTQALARLSSRRRIPGSPTRVVSNPSPCNPTIIF